MSRSWCGAQWDAATSNRLAAYAGKEWVDGATATVDADGHIVSDDRSGISLTTSLILVQE